MTLDRVTVEKSSAFPYLIREMKHVKNCTLMFAVNGVRNDTRDLKNFWHLIWHQAIDRSNADDTPVHLDLSGRIE